MDRRLSRRQFLGASAGAAAFTFLGGGGTRAFGRSSAGGPSDRSAAPARRPALLGARRDGPGDIEASHRLGVDAHDGPPRRSGLPA